MSKRDPSVQILKDILKVLVSFTFVAYLPWIDTALLMDIIGITGCSPEVSHYLRLSTIPFLVGSGACLWIARPFSTQD